MISPTQRHQVRRNLADKRYRDQLVAETIFSRLPLKVRFLREKTGKSQKLIARESGKAQTWISKLEDPNYGRFSVNTLLEVASMYDVGLKVDFVPFSQVLDDFSNSASDSWVVPTYTDEKELIEGAYLGKAPLGSQPANQQEPLSPLGEERKKKQVERATSPLDHLSKAS